MKGKITLAGVLLTAIIGTTQEAKCNATLVLPQGITLQQIGFCNGPTGASQSFFYDYIVNGSQISVPLHNRTRLHVTLKDGTSSLFWENDVVDGATYTIDKSAAKTYTLTTLNTQLSTIQNQVTQLQSQITTAQNKLTTSGQQILQQIIALQTSNDQSQISQLISQLTPNDLQSVQQIIQLQRLIALIQGQVTRLQNQITAINQLPY